MTILWDWLVSIINFLIDVVCGLAIFLLELLPDSPFQFTQLDWGDWGDSVGTFFPIGSMVTHLALILTACGLFYVARWALRMIRMIQ